MRPKRPNFWKMSAQEIREKKSSRTRTQRATRPVWARISKMLPMKRVLSRKRMSAPHEKQNLFDTRNVAHGWKRVKRNGMRVCAGSLPAPAGKARKCGRGRKKSVGWIGLGGEEELHAEIADEIGLIGARGFKAASGHEEQNDRSMDFVAAADADGWLAFGGMEGALGIEFQVQFEFGGEVVAHDEAGDPTVGSFMDELIAEFGIDVEGAKFFGELKGQEKRIAGWSNAARNRIVGIVQKELRESRDREATFSRVVETPLDAEIGLAEAEFRRGRGILDAQPGIFVGELDAIANSEIDIEVGNVGDGLVAIEKGHVGGVDFPIEMAGSARVVGVEGRATLGARGSNGEEQAG